MNYNSNRDPMKIVDEMWNANHYPIKEEKEEVDDQRNKPINPFSLKSLGSKKKKKDKEKNVETPSEKVEKLNRKIDGVIEQERENQVKRIIKGIRNESNR